MAKKKHIEVGAQQLGRLYAEALLGAAGGSLEEVVEELEAVERDAISAQPRFRRLLASGMITADEKVKIVDRVFSGRVSPVLLRFLKVVAERDRLEFLGAIAEQARELVNERLGRVSVGITTAAPLDAAVSAELAEAIRARLGKVPVLETEIDPRLIGGVLVRIGDRVFDGSVANKLARLGASLRARHAAAIETATDTQVSRFVED